MERRGAIIFDRDGVLVVDVDYGYRPEQMVWIDGAAEAVKLVNEAGLYAFVATNQSGVGRGYFTEADVEGLHAWMAHELSLRGARIDGFVYCTDHPDRATPRRKPGPGMILELIEQHGLDPAGTVVIGDKPTDVEAAAAAGVEGLLFTGGSLLEAVRPVVARIAAGAEVTGRPA